MQNNRLYRSNESKMIAGVCGGLAEFFGLDPTLVRLLFVLLALMGGHGLLIYIILWIIVPYRTAASAVVSAVPVDSSR
jgi:phage shock protein C